MMKKSQTGGEDLFSMYQREEAQRAERSTHDAEAAARVLEKAGGPEPEEEPAEPERDEPAKAAEPSTREFPSLTVLDTPAAPRTRQNGGRWFHPNTPHRTNLQGIARRKTEPTETEIPVPQADAEQIRRTACFASTARPRRRERRLPSPASARPRPLFS